MTQHKLFKLQRLNQEQHEIIEHARGKRHELPPLKLPSTEHEYKLEKLLDEGTVTIRTNFEMRK
jgi:hypothetical protein